MRLRMTYLWLACKALIYTSTTVLYVRCVSIGTGMPFCGMQDTPIRIPRLNDLV
jgi:hypothetical protein